MRVRWRGRTRRHRGTPVRVCGRSGIGSATGVGPQESLEVCDDHGCWESTRVALSAINVGENVRELDEAHVAALARSIALRGLIVPLAVRPDGEGRYLLVAGRHRHAACTKLGWQEAEVTVREQDATSADTAAENIVRKQLSPLGEAGAVGAMLNDGLTLDGTAEALGWSRELVRAGEDP